MFEKFFGKNPKAESSEAGPSERGIVATERGFEPARIRVARDETVTLVVTRKVAKTCARELVIDELDINEPLPLDETVKIAITPRQSGSMKFGCAMDKMIGGVIEVV